MSVHQVDVKASEAREALNAVVRVVAGGHGQAFNSHIRTIDLFIRQHEAPASQAVPDKTDDEDKPHHKGHKK